MTPIAIALLLGQGPAADLQAPISFEHRAAPVGRVLANLSEKTKLKLEALPTVAGDVVLVSVKDVPLTELLQKIATVTACEWRQDGETYRLVPSAGIRNREAQDEFSARVTALRASIAQRLKPPTPPAPERKSGADTEPTEPDYEGMAAEAIQGGMFGDAPLLKLVQNVDLRAIASLRPNDRVVFSTQPTRMQRPLPANAGTLINTMVAQHNASLKKLGTPDIDDEMPQGVEIPQFVKDMMSQRTKPVGEVSKGLIVASRMGMGGFGGVNLELLLYDRDGKIAYKTNTMLSETSRAVERAVEAVQGKKKPVTTKQTPIELSPETKLVRESLGKSMGMGGMSGIKLSPAVKALVYHPDIYDPLSFLPSDSLLAVAKKQGRPIVANLPDEMDMVDLLDMPGGNSLTVEQVEEDLRAAEQVRTIEDTKFLLIKPAKPAAAREDRLDRVALTALMQVVDTKGIPTLDDVAAYAAKAPNPMEGGIGQSYVMMLAPGAFSASMSGFTNWNAIRFYGLLSPEARRGLAGGGRLAFSALSPAQSAHLQKMAYGTQANLQVEDPNQKPETETMSSMMRMMGMGVDRDFRTEPTEVMPNGLPSDGFVSADVLADFFVSPVLEGDEPTMGPLAVLGADELAMFKMFREDKNYSMMMGMMPSIDRVKLGERSVWTMMFHVAPKTAMKAVLNDNRMAKGGKTVALNDLPAAHQKRIALKLEEIKKSPLGSIGGMLGGMGGGQTPPP